MSIKLVIQAQGLNIQAAVTDAALGELIRITQEYRDQEAESTGAMTTVSSLGERARLSGGAASGLPSHVVMLYVVKGNALITVGLAGLDDDAVAGQEAKSVAEKILAEL